MEIRLALSLPRDASSVPLTRQVLDSALEALGVTGETRGDVRLVLTEACANVVQHAGAGDQYEVTVAVREGCCAMEVMDQGRGFDESALEREIPEGEVPEHGRGLSIIKALSENVKLSSYRKNGSKVHFEVPLKWKEDAPGRRLATGSRSG
ncbi:ATP-binding protein [Bailinhaonella thermotolerans]|nr:ATP-binding protein [Bailinhaonella thermotolerans]